MAKAMKPGSAADKRMEKRTGIKPGSAADKRMEAGGTAAKKGLPFGGKQAPPFGKKRA